MKLRNDAKSLEEYHKYLIEIERESAFQHFRKAGFPYYNMRDYERIQVFRRLIQTDLKLSKPEETVFGKKRHLEISALGVDLSTDFNPHIFSSHAIGMKSALENYNDDDCLRYVIKLCTEKAGGYNLSDQNVRSILKLVKGTQICSNFRPLVAKAIYKVFNRGPIIFDPSAGYGGRLLGFMAAFPIGDHIYIGVDPDERTCKGNEEMIKFFGFEDRAVMINSPMEEVDIDDIGGKESIDFAFTSPPYFKKEIYSHGNEQSCNRYLEYRNWKKYFWEVTIGACYDLLKPKRYCGINIKNVIINGKTYNLVDDTKKIAEKAGFKFIEEIWMQYPHRFGKGEEKKPRGEPILIFLKE